VVLSFAKERRSFNRIGEQGMPAPHASANPNLREDVAHKTARTYRAEDAMNQTKFFIEGSVRSDGGEHLLSFLVVSELADGTRGTVRGVEFFTIPLTGLLSCAPALKTPLPTRQRGSMPHDGNITKLKLCAPTHRGQRDIIRMSSSDSDDSFIPPFCPAEVCDYATRSASHSRLEEKHCQTRTRISLPLAS
jgi:hypothetical protein